MPMVAGSHDRDAGLRADRRGALPWVFGGFAAKELANPIEDAKRTIFFGELRLEPGRIVHYKRCSTRPSNLSSAKPRPCHHLQRPQQSCDRHRGRDHDWAALRHAAFSPRRRLTVCRCSRDRSALYSLHLGHDPANPKAGARTMATLVALKWSMFNLLRRQAGEVWCAAPNRLGGRPQLYHLWTLASWRDLDHVRGQADRQRRTAGRLLRVI